MPCRSWLGGACRCCLTNKIKAGLQQLREVALRILILRYSNKYSRISQNKIQNALVLPNISDIIYFEIFTKNEGYLKIKYEVKKMIGRKKEVAELEELYDGTQAELVAVYGRRRIGKTYLVEQTFKNRFAFRHAGLSPVEHEKKGMLEAQLNHFYHSLRSFGLKEEGKCPSNWLDAFFMLQQLLEEKDDGNRQVVFIDELPWMDTARSGFITALEGFWNNWGAHRDNLLMIVCGSANSWMLDKLINNHGGLYGRVTYEIRLSPFSLGECEQFFKSKKSFICTISKGDFLWHKT